MLINIRGTSGSGKSTLVRKVMDKIGVRAPYQSPGKRKPLIKGYALNGGIAVVGRYETACGGCDTIKTQDEIEELVRKYHKEMAHVIWEGLLVCSSYGRWSIVDDEIGPTQWVFLDTPYEQCLTNILIRRKKANNDKPHDNRSRDNCRFKFDTNLKVFEKCNTAGRSAHHVDADTAFHHIIKWIDSNV